jgi:hypothetical protein
MILLCGDDPGVDRGRLGRLDADEDDLEKS